MKQRATIVIGCFRYRRLYEGPMFYYHEQPYGLPPCDDLEEAYQNYIRHWREYQRKKFRERLDELKKE